MTDHLEKPCHGEDYVTAGKGPSCKMCEENEATVVSDNGELIMCQKCFDEWQRENNKIKDLEDQGHSSHCACRQVWGDGECECDLSAKGYDPYAWMQNNKRLTE